MLNPRDEVPAQKKVRFVFDDQEEALRTKVTEPASGNQPDEPQPALTDENQGVSEDKANKTDVSANLLAGEPPLQENAARPEEYVTDQFWKPENRASWQLHSEKGPNVQPEGRTQSSDTLPADINPMDYDWHAPWSHLNLNTLREKWRAFADHEDTAYSEEDLSKDTLGDDFQTFFRGHRLGTRSGARGCGL